MGFDGHELRLVVGPDTSGQAGAQHNQGQRENQQFFHGNFVAICPNELSSPLTDKAPSSLMDEMDQTIQVLKRLNDELRMMKNAIG